MQITFLGTGAAGGVPLYGCDCIACERARQDTRYVRRPCSALVETESTRILVDAGLTDLHERFAPGYLTAVLLTHFHPDHVQGLLHWRWGKAEPLSVFCPPDEEGCADLFKHPGFLRFSPVQKQRTFSVGDLLITPLQLVHSRLTYGYSIRSAQGVHIAYLTDTIGLPDRTHAWLAGHELDALCIDTSYPPQEPAAKENKRNSLNHNDLNLSLELITSLKPRSAYLTHIGHLLDAWLMKPASPVDNTDAIQGGLNNDAVCVSSFPAGVHVAHDTQTVKFASAS